MKRQTDAGAGLFRGGDDRSLIMLNRGMENPGTVVSSMNYGPPTPGSVRAKWIPGLKRDSPNTFPELKWMENPIRVPPEVTLGELFPLTP